ncbi:hypothetical protein C1645_823941 [Glomus cerebriforme]|uniref:Uncharacterized protein n=1 Tax=Glomus cerebriforme TaxID=658196 RepID=A0A397SYD1_9GLOM|nr:hypothetical protein C1645_823941 [Glomus cerebriforme]
MNYLPYDCLYDILKLLQNDRSSLFNCSLVNRFWCESTVPLLYANPFDNLTNKKNYSIILTLVLCFNNEKILILKNQLKFINIKNIKIDDKYKSLFKYPKFLKNINYYKITFIIIKWVESYLDLSYDYRKIHKDFIPTFYHFILHQCINIKQLSIPLYLFCNKKYNIQNFYNLTNLNSLSLDLQDINLSTTQKFLINIKNFCSNLNLLEISTSYQQHNNFINNIDDIKSIKENLCTIIQNQNNLKGFNISLCDYLLNNIFLSLEFQKYSLVYIEFERINFDDISFKNLINLYSLKYLKFDNCKGLTLKKCDMLLFASFNLKELIFMHNVWNQCIIPSMIRYLGASLQRLLLFEYLKPSFIESISKYCSNLIILEIRIESQIDDLLAFKYLKIKILNINIYYYHDGMFITKLANYLPINVKEITIHFHHSCRHSLDLKKFLENCHDQLELINLDQFIEYEFLKIILNYIERSKNNSLKILGMKKLRIKV